MARFSNDARLVAAIRDGVEVMHRRHIIRKRVDSHDLINWMDTERNSELNDIYAMYRDCKDPEMTADQQIGKYLYQLGQHKVGNRLSSRHITRRDGTNRDGECSVSIWEITPLTMQAIKDAQQRAANTNDELLAALFDDE
jgi:hypothetical protein